MRSQCLEPSAINTTNVTTPTSSKGITATEWIKDANDWGDGDDMDDEDDLENFNNISEENGNVITITTGGAGGQPSKSDLDDEDESCSMEDSLRLGLEELYVDSKNANNGKLLAEAQGSYIIFLADLRKRGFQFALY